MKYAYMLNGGQPVFKRFKVSETFANAGVYATNTAAAGAGLVLGLATTVANQVGVTLDTSATYSTTQGDPEATVNVIISPSAVFKALMANGATAGTAIVRTTNSAASAAGTVVTITTGDAAPNSPEMDEGTIVCIEGANKGQWRKITSTAATTATVTVPFLNDIAVGEIFIIHPFTEGDVAADNVNFTDNITQARHDIAVGTGADFRPIETEIDFAGVDNALRNSYVYILADDHIYRETT